MPKVQKPSANSVKKILRCKPSDHLGSVLDWVQSSHDAIFVFDDKNNFLGLCSPYQTLYKKRFPYTTSVEHCLVHPPEIYDTTPFYQTADFMNELRIYTLPILTKKKKFKSAINAKDFIRQLLKDKSLLKQVAQNLELGNITTADIHATVGQIYDKLRKKGITRICLVDKLGKLTGIVTRSDIKHAFIHPTPKQRFAKNLSYSTSWSFDEEKVKRLDDPVRNYFTEFVETTSDRLSNEEIIKKLLKSGKNSSVVLTDAEKPIGIVSISTILKTISKLKPQENINVVFKKPSNNVDTNQINEVKNLLQEFGQKMNKRWSIKRIEFHINEPKYTNLKTALYNITLVLVPVAGKPVVSKSKDKVFLVAVRSAIREIEKQLKHNKVKRAPKHFDPLIKSSVHP
ncbi:CBS domain-containing protein [Candidatus Daviesbacteria bacterium]|nr:CBS domain-containing protein [Candidatus Daviesbacteria bacterium]